MGGASRWGVLTAILAGLICLMASGVAEAAPLPVGNFSSGVASEFTDPGGNPPGSDVWNCRPSASHPYPVILVHGTLANENFSWQALSPMLANAGYCVYAFNYGAASSTNGYFYAEGDIAQSALQLDFIVGLVLNASGAHQVDIVGHSQGGMMPRYYIQNLGGASRVHTLVGLAPSNHGTTLWGVVTLASLLQGGQPSTSFGGLDCPACSQQEAGSSFLQSLNANGDTVPGPHYVVIESQYDEVVTPYQSAFLHGPDVENILLQNQCPIDFTEHLSIVYDAVALQDVLNVLGPDSPGFAPACSLVLPGLGSY
jgi:pimeloyl-ACP methyl ester carboxylesterase